MQTDARTTRAGAGRLALPAAASIGAGAVHAVAVGGHSEHIQAVWLFTVVAVLQLGWGAVALVRPSRAVALVGLVVNAAALAGFVLAKTAGIAFVGGLTAAEPVQAADAIAAALALLAVAGTALHLADRLPSALPPALVGAGALTLAALALPGMFFAGRHAHDGHDGATTVAAGAAVSDGHGHGDGHGSDDGAVLASDDGDGHGDHGGHGSTTPEPYDPTKPIDLSGMEGVTPEQQAAAENLVATSLVYLPQFADTAAAEAAGYHSIGDGMTGYEHFVNWSLLSDDRQLDPTHPESLVYRVENGERTLEAAMFMLDEGDTIDDAPELGGPLTQWHIHDDLCYTDDPVAPKVRGLREPGGPCTPPLVPGREVPMIHVWIVPHECGPFAALEGVGAGAIAEGEERLCDHAHGAGH